MYTELGVGVRKTIRVYVDKDIEFNVEINNDQLTCGWLLSEVDRRYTDEMTKVREERERQLLIKKNSSGMNHPPPSPHHSKVKRRIIVALKTSD